MKKILLLVIGLSLTIACEDPFDLTPTDIISETFVFEDMGLADAFTGDLYNRTQFHMTSGGTNINMGFINSWGGEHRNFAPWQAAFGQVTNTPYNENGAGLLDYWPYNNIREANVFIENIVKSEMLDPSYTSVRAAEARFIRAWEYFEMAKHFGGVPIITQAQGTETSDADLFLPRNSEKEVYDFIGQKWTKSRKFYQNLPIKMVGRPNGRLWPSKVEPCCMRLVLLAMVPSNLMAYLASQHLRQTRTFKSLWMHRERLSKTVPFHSIVEIPIRSKISSISS
ncbi:MAG: RagB/SusD family nutrient uptake outer membrane protein [Bacteroidota bacterium]